MSDVRPYRRRYRGRGRGGDVAAGIDELRALNERAEAPRRDVPPPRDAPRRSPSQSPRRPRRWWSLRGRRPGQVVARLAGFLGIAVVLWAGFGFLAIWRAAGESHDGLHQGVRGVLDTPSGGLLSDATNTLIVGSDARVGKSSRPRADTLMILRTDPDGGHMRMLSIPRDLRVALPRYGDEKIAHAYHYFGQRGTIRAVRRLTGLEIHHIVVISFNGLADAVDAVGGVDVTVPQAMTCSYSGGVTVSFEKGRQRLNGERALVYARARTGCGDDFGRMPRQQQILTGLKNRIVSPLSLPLAPWRGAGVVRAITTDLGALDLAKLGWLQATLASDASDRFTIKGFPQSIGGVSYVTLDREASEAEISRFTG